MWPGGCTLNFQNHKSPAAVRGAQKWESGASLGLLRFYMAEGETQAGPEHRMIAKLIRSTAEQIPCRTLGSS